MEENKKIEKQSLSEVSTILTSLIKIAEWFGELSEKVGKYRQERRQKKMYKNAEKALRRKDVKKINDMLRP